MTPKATINSGLAGGDRSGSLDRYAARLYEKPGPVMGVVELLPVDRITPVDEGSKKDPIVRLRIDLLELAPAGEQDEILRQVAVALKTARTAAGTLTGDEDVKLSEDTLRLVGDRMSDHELARMRVILDWFLNHTRAVIDHPKHRAEDIKRLLNDALFKAMAARDAGVQLDLDGGGR
jgi:hypothetical protein